MKNVHKAILVGLFVLLSGCGSNKVQETPPLSNIVTKEVLIPMAVCPKEVDQVPIPTRPALAIDDLTPADRTNYKKVGTAYMTTVNDLQAYSRQLEDAVYGVKDICHSVNTPLSGK